MVHEPSYRVRRLHMLIWLRRRIGLFRHHIKQHPFFPPEPVAAQIEGNPAGPGRKFRPGFPSRQDLPRPQESLLRHILRLRRIPKQTKSHAINDGHVTPDQCRLGAPVTPCRPADFIGFRNERHSLGLEDIGLLAAGQSPARTAITCHEMVSPALDRARVVARLLPPLAQRQKSCRHRSNRADQTYASCVAHSVLQILRR